MVTTSLPSILHFISYLHTAPVMVLFGVPLAFLILDLITGVARAVKQKVFQWNLLSDFLAQDVLKYIVVLAIVGVSFLFFDNTVVASVATALGLAPLSASVLSSVYGNIRELFSPQVAQVVEEAGAAAGYPDPKPEPTPIVLPNVNVNASEGNALAGTAGTAAVVQTPQAEKGIDGSHA